MGRKSLKGLYVDSIHMLPVDYSWDGENFGDGWEFAEAVRCDGCGKVIVSSYSGERHCDLDEETSCEAEIWGIEGPMMNYWYPIKLDDCSEAAAKIVDLPLCVVSIEGNTGLALTGGGMDLSWEICEAFMLLGQLPPLHFCRLPNMAGKKFNARNQWIMSGCAKSIRVAKNQAYRMALDIRHTRSLLKENSERS